MTVAIWTVGSLASLVSLVLSLYVLRRERRLEIREAILEKREDQLEDEVHAR
jgi:hypothetical protein